MNCTSIVSNNCNAIQGMLFFCGDSKIRICYKFLKDSREMRVLNGELISDFNSFIPVHILVLIFISLNLDIQVFIAY